MMIQVRILDPGESGAIPEMRLEDVQHFLDCSHAIIMGCGTQSGKSAVQFAAQTPEGKWVMLQLTASMLDSIQAASVGARRRWGEDVSGAIIPPQ